MEISELLARPPEALNEFSVTLDHDYNVDGPPAARYQLACPRCGGDIFVLEEILSGEHGASGVAAMCGECGETGTVFHASRHGYDGRLGHLRFLQEITGRQPVCDDDQQPVREAQIACEVSYSVDPEELASVAVEEGIPAQDLFDGVTILTRRSASDSWRNVWAYECA